MSEDLSVRIWLARRLVRGELRRLEQRIDHHHFDRRLSLRIDGLHVVLEAIA